LRKRIVGTSERPRLTVYRSLQHMYAQIVDDMTGRTLVSASTAQAKVAGGNVKAAETGEPAEVRDLSKCYGDVAALRDFELTCPPSAADRVQS
jgi:large subunit ribosomal protein L18